MEPISAPALTAALTIAPVSIRPPWEDVSLSCIMGAHDGAGSEISTFVLWVMPRGFDEASVGSSVEFPSVSLNPKEILMREVLSYNQYTDGWNGAGSIGPDGGAIRAATAFIEIIPSRLTLPRPMLSSDGEVGLYWGIEDGYAEVTFEPAGEFSFFSRSKEGEEKFQENMKLDMLAQDWFWSEVGVFDRISKIV